MGVAAVAHADDVTVFAAASLTDALTEAGAKFEAETGTHVVFSFASSSALAKQIEAGAPAHIFASAAEEWMDYLDERSLIEPETRVSPISNALVLIAPATSAQGAVTVDASLDLAALLPEGGRIAVGDPDHVPAGVYAKEALTTLGLWDEAEPRLARADDVRAALALVARGEAPLGIVYATDALVSDDVKVIGTFREDSHTPITYPFAIIKGQRTEEAGTFFDYVAVADGLAIFHAAGFTTP